MSFQHFLITRFNARLPILERLPDAAWLDHRFELFEQFCLPSVQYQTNQNFLWLVFLDHATPDPFRARLQTHVQAGLLYACYVDIFAYGTVRDSLQNLKKPGVETIITTRLDNDDALAKDYVATVQAAAQGSARMFINFRFGYYWCAGCLYHKEEPSSSFVSLVQPAAESSTAYCCNHERIAEHGPVLQITDKPGYLKVIHDRNIVSKLPDMSKSVTVSKVYADFPLAVLKR